jgi:hypothetical protein
MQGQRVGAEKGQQSDSAAVDQEGVAARGTIAAVRTRVTFARRRQKRECSSDDAGRCGPQRTVV